MRRNDQKRSRAQGRPAEVRPIGYREEYAEAKKKLDDGRAVWQPKTKTVAFPHGFIVWIGADDQKLCRMDTSGHRYVRYVVTGKAGNDTTIVLATAAELSKHQDELVGAGVKVVDKLPEPYHSRLAAVLLSLS